MRFPLIGLCRRWDTSKATSATRPVADSGDIRRLNVYFYCQRNHSHPPADGERVCVPNALQGYWLRLVYHNVMSLDSQIFRWRTEVFALAWKSYVSGNFPAGAVILSKNGDCVSKGSNTANLERSTEEIDEIRGSRIAHAEINALYSLGYIKQKPIDLQIVCSHEPCAMCMGALQNFELHKTLFFARDPHVRAFSIYSTKFDGLESEASILHIQSASDEAVYVGLQTDYLLRTSTFRKEKAQLLSSYCPIGVKLGEKLFQENFFSQCTGSTASEEYFGYLFRRVDSLLTSSIVF